MTESLSSLNSYHSDRFAETSTTLTK